MNLQILSALLQTPLKAGAIIMVCTITAMALFDAVFYILIANPVDGIPFELVMVGVFVLFVFGSIMLWFRLGRLLPVKFNIAQRLTAIVTGISPILAGTIYHYWKLAYLGYAGCSGGNIIGMIVGTAATIGAFVTLIVSSRPDQATI